MITIEELRDRLEYNPETGQFMRKKSLSNAHRSGVIAGSTRPPAGYVWVKIGQKSIAAHRLAVFMMTGAWPEHEVDHINGNRADNRWANLRQATRAENMCNKATYKNSESGVPGVTFHKRIGMWQVRVQANGTRLHLGYFDDFDVAVGVREAAEIDAHGKFSARLSRVVNGAIP